MYGGGAAREDWCGGGLWCLRRSLEVLGVVTPDLRAAWRSPNAYLPRPCPYPCHSHMHAHPSRLTMPDRTLCRTATATWCGPRRAMRAWTEAGASPSEHEGTVGSCRSSGCVRHRLSGASFSMMWMGLPYGAFVTRNWLALIVMERPASPRSGIVPLNDSKAGCLPCQHVILLFCCRLHWIVFGSQVAWKHPCSGGGGRMWRGEEGTGIG